MEGQGQTAIFELFTDSVEFLRDEEFLIKLCRDYIELIGMHYGGFTFSGQFPNIFHQNVAGGITIMMILLESHICLHSWIEIGKLHLEISSCKDFGVKMIEKKLRAMFHPYRFYTQICPWQLKIEQKGE